VAAVAIPTSLVTFVRTYGRCSIFFCQYRLHGDAGVERCGAWEAFAPEEAMLAAELGVTVIPTIWM
jgi:hypothetical protein